MKKIIVLVLIILCSSLVAAADISNSFTEKYQSLIPKENSSVQSDYLFEQIALGSEYTVKMLDQLNNTNENTNEKIDRMIEKFNVLIEQNKKIIELLEHKNKDS